MATGERPAPAQPAFRDRDEFLAWRDERYRDIDALLRAAAGVADWLARSRTSHDEGVELEREIIRLSSAISRWRALPPDSASSEIMGWRTGR